MRIGIDCRIIREEPSGMKRVALNLVKNLMMIDRRNSYLIFINQNSKEKFTNCPKNFKIRTLPFPQFSISEQALLPPILKKEKLDIFHSLSFAMPFFNSIPSIMTIYDLIHLIFPQNYSKKLSLYYKFMVKPSAKRVKKILTISENSRHDIINLLGVPPEKVCVIYAAVDKCFKSIEESNVKEKLGRKYGIKKEFILYVGNMRPHKNLISLIRAFSSIVDNSLDYNLVICGEKKYSYKMLISEISDLKLRRRVIFLDSISENDLISLYNAAEVLVQPSVYEGFGLPPLEAIACGTPVAVSDIEPLREMLKDAAVFFNPYNVQDISKKMVKVLTDEELRNKLINRGFELVKLYSWEESAKKLLALYEEVYNS